MKMNKWTNLLSFIIFFKYNFIRIKLNSFSNITNKFNNPNDFFKTLELFLSSSIISNKSYKQKYIIKDTLYSCIDKTAFENLLIQNSQRQDLSEKELELLEIYNKPREW